MKLNKRSCKNKITCTTYKITPYSPFRNDIVFCGLFFTLRQTDVFPCPEKAKHLHQRLYGHVVG